MKHYYRSIIVNGTCYKYKIGKKFVEILYNDTNIPNPPKWLPNLDELNGGAIYQYGKDNIVNPITPYIISQYIKKVTNAI